MEKLLASIVKGAGEEELNIKVSDIVATLSPRRVQNTVKTFSQKSLLNGTESYVFLLSKSFREQYIKRNR